MLYAQLGPTEKIINIIFYSISYHYIFSGYIKEFVSIKTNNAEDNFGLVLCFMSQSTAVVMSGTISLPNHTFFLGKLDLGGLPVLCAHSFACN